MRRSLIRVPVLVPLALVTCSGPHAVAKTAAKPIKTATAVVVSIQHPNDAVLNVGGKLRPAYVGGSRLMIAGDVVTLREFQSGDTVRIRYWVSAYATPSSENPLGAASYYQILSMGDPHSSKAFFEHPTFGGTVRSIREDANSFELDVHVTPAGPPLLPTRDLRLTRKSRFWLRGRRLSCADGLKALSVGDYVYAAEEPGRAHYVYALFDRESWRQFAAAE
jgi:hypothetical protein